MAPTTQKRGKRFDLSERDVIIVNFTKTESRLEISIWISSRKRNKF